MLVTGCLLPAAVGLALKGGEGEAQVEPWGLAWMLSPGFWEVQGPQPRVGLSLTVCQEELLWLHALQAGERAGGWIESGRGCTDYS